MNLSDISVIDQHAHNLLQPEVFSNYPYPAAFTESHDSEILNYHARYTLCYRRSLRDIATVLECEAEEDAILQHRTNLGLQKLTEVCFNAAKISTILLDDGFLPEQILPIEWHQQFLPVYRLLRLEHLAQNLLTQVDSFETFLDCFRAEIDPIPTGVVGFKSIAAYRTGLDIQPVSKDLAKSHFHKLVEQKNTAIRLSDKPLIDFLVMQALEVAAKYRIPVQFHTGFGDTDLDLQKANPLYLRSLLENPAYRNAPIVLLHASYPYTREAGYLASVYPQVYLDFGLAVPYLSVAGMHEVMRMLLELAPTTKIMYSSDAHFIPEIYYLGAKWGRKVLGNVLEQAIKDTNITAKEAEEISVSILQENCCKLYCLT